MCNVHERERLDAKIKRFFDQFTVLEIGDSKQIKKNYIKKQQHFIRDYTSFEWKSMGQSLNAFLEHSYKAQMIFSIRKFK